MSSSATDICYYFEKKMVAIKYRVYKNHTASNYCIGWFGSVEELLHLSIWVSIMHLGFISFKIFPLSVQCAFENYSSKHLSVLYA